MKCCRISQEDIDQLERYLEKENSELFLDDTDTGFIEESNDETE
jgi:hypothetical protein